MTSLIDTWIVIKPPLLLKDSIELTVLCDVVLSLLVSYVGSEGHVAQTILSITDQGVVMVLSNQTCFKFKGQVAVNRTNGVFD